MEIINNQKYYTKRDMQKFMIDLYDNKKRIYLSHVSRNIIQLKINSDKTIGVTNFYSKEKYDKFCNWICFLKKWHETILEAKRLSKLRFDILAGKESLDEKN